MEIETAGSFQEVLKLQADGSAADANLFVMFEEVEVEDKAASDKEGRPIFKTKHVGTIRIPADPGNTVTFDPNEPDYRRRFGAKYDLWKKDRTNRLGGTLLRECGGLMSRARAREWEALGVFTVEALAALTDANVQNMMHGVKERQAAHDYLAAAAGRAPLTEARAENAKLKGQVEALTERLASLEKLLEENTSPGPKKGKG